MRMDLRVHVRGSNPAELRRDLAQQIREFVGGVPLQYEEQWTAIERTFLDTTYGERPRPLYEGDVFVTLNV